LSDADEGPKWLLDRWHIARACKLWQAKINSSIAALMTSVRKAQSGSVRGALRRSDLSKLVYESLARSLRHVRAIEMASITGRASLCICVTRRTVDHAGVRGQVGES
jgi:hypothetical protein